MASPPPEANQSGQAQTLVWNRRPWIEPDSPQNFEVLFGDPHLLARQQTQRVTSPWSATRCFDFTWLMVADAIWSARCRPPRRLCSYHFPRATPFRSSATGKCLRYQIATGSVPHRRLSLSRAGLPLLFRIIVVYFCRRTGTLRRRRRDSRDRLRLRRAHSPARWTRTHWPGNSRTLARRARTHTCLYRSDRQSVHAFPKGRGLPIRFRDALRG
jgi:hypothetical protein